MAIKFDFQSTKDRMVEKLRAKVSWADILPFSSNQRIIDVVADEIQEVARMDESIAREMKWTLAKNRTSLVSQAPALKYAPKRKRGATGFVEVSSNADAFSDLWYSYQTYAQGVRIRYNGMIYESLQGSNVNRVPDVSPTYWRRVRTIHSANVGIPKWTEFMSITSLPYCAIEGRTLTPSLDFVRVPVVQGVYKSLSFTALGLDFEEFEISNDSVDDTYYEVYVNSVKWTEIEDLADADAGEMVFEVENMIDFSGLYLKFGDGFYGRKLSAGDTIQFRFVQTDGSSGNITTQNSITTVSSSVKDDAGETVPLFCNNYESIAGGKDMEDIESIRRNAVRSYQSGESLGYKESLKSYLETNFSFIGNCVVWGAYEYNVDRGLDPSAYVPAQENLVYISAYTPGANPIDILLNPDGSVNTSYRLQIMKEIQDKKELTDIFRFTEVDFVPMALHSSVVVRDPSYLLSEVVENVRAALVDAYSIDKIDFMQGLYKSQFHSTISAISQVDHHTSYVELFNEEAFIAGEAGVTPYAVEGILKIFPIKQGSVRVVVVDSVTGLEYLVAHDEDRGVQGWGFVADTGFTITGSSSINYTNGDFELYINSGLTGAYQRFQVKVYYLADSDDVLLKTRNQVLYLKETTDITASYL